MTDTPAIAALILAAGRSSRMGVLKALLPLGKLTFVEAATRVFIQAGIRDICVVTGHEHKTVTPLLDRLRVPWIFNPDHDRGMLGSILAGVKNLPPHVNAFFLLPVDTPLVKPGTVKLLMDAHRALGSWVTYPRFLGQRGHPPLIALKCIGDSLTPEYEGGMRAYLMRCEDRAADVDVIDEGILLGCNTSEEHETLSRVHSMTEVPTEKECTAIWEMRGTPEAVLRHCRAVGELAGTLAVRLNMKGLRLDPDLLVAAGRLHDIARGEPEHARAGADFLRQLGYGRTADLVAQHMDIVLQEEGLDESALLFLADKCVKEDRIVSPRERFDQAGAKWAGNPEAVAAIQKRRRDAMTIAHRVESALGQSLESILHRHEKDIHLASSHGITTLYLVRHGSVEMEGGGSRCLGQKDVPLDAEGIRQAEALRDSLRHVRFSAVYSSDLKRSFDTAAIIAEPHGVKPKAIPGLREIHLGSWEGLTFDMVRAGFPELYEERGRDMAHCRPPGGESFLDCARRVIPATVEILRANRGNILVAGHAGVNRVILCRALGWSLDRVLEIRQSYGCINVLRCEGVTWVPEIIDGEDLCS